MLFILNKQGTPSVASIVGIGHSTTPVVPSAPTGVTATAGNGQATVSWTAPSDGNSPITSYTVTPYVGSTAQTPTVINGNPPATSTTVGGLTNGVTYTFTVTATNAVGTGPASAASNAVTPTAPTAPAAPTGVTAAAGNTTATVAWTAPADGGSPITSYTVTPYLAGNAPDRDDRDRLAAGHDRHDQRADERVVLHVHGDRHQRRRHRAGIGRVQRGHAVSRRDTGFRPAGQHARGPGQ